MSKMGTLYIEMMEKQASEEDQYEGYDNLHICNPENTEIENTIAVDCEIIPF